MKPSDHCKAAGLKDLKELSQITGQSVQTLITWHNTKLELFKQALENAVKAKEKK